MTEISQNVNIEMLEKLPDGTYKRKYPATKAEVVKLVDAQNKFTNKNVEGAMNELFTNVSSGKELVGGAITDVDESVVIPTDPTFNDLASAIGQISAGKKWASGIATDYTRSATITGLDFTPSIIIFHQTRYTTQHVLGVYCPSLFTAQPDRVHLIQSYNATGTALRGSIQINADGFRAYDGWYSDNPLSWIAFE